MTYKAVQHMRRLVVISFILVILIFGDVAIGFNPMLIDPSIGKKAPAFTLNDLKGNPVTLQAFNGQPVLLNFWATWCPYCREERSHLNDLHRDYHSKGLVIISISTDRSVSVLKRFMKQYPAPFIVLSDTRGEISSSYNIMGLPSSLLIDDDGVIKYKFTGFRDWSTDSSRKLVESLL